MRRWQFAHFHVRIQGIFQEYSPPLHLQKEATPSFERTSRKTQHKGKHNVTRREELHSYLTL
jgi:hypothetical protein